MKKFILSFYFLWVCTTVLVAQTTPGNLVILRVGNGSSTLNGNTRALSLVEITQSGSNASTYNVPTSNSGSNYRLTLRGNAEIESCINLAQDATKIVFPGYVTDPGTNNPNSTSSSIIPRGFGILDSSGLLNTSTTTTDYSSLSIRGATTLSGSSFYSSGEIDSTNNDGVRYFSTVGGSGSGTQIFDGNSRGIHISTYLGSDGNLKHILATNSANNVAVYGNYQDTLPTISVSNNSLSLGADGQIIDFLPLDVSQNINGADLLYIACRPNADGNDVIAKYSFNGSNWTYRGSLIRDTPSTNRFYCQGITGYKNSSGNIVLFITGNTTDNPGNELYTFTDTHSRTSDISSNGSTFVSVATSLLSAGTNYSFRGVTWAPSSFATNPSNASTCFPGSANFSVAMSTGTNAVYEYYWQRSSDSGSTWTTITSTTDGSVYSGFNSASLTADSTTSAMNGYQYRCLVRYMSQYWLTSGSATLTVTGIVTSYPNTNTVPSGTDCYSSSPVTIGSSNWYKSTSMSAGLTPQSDEMWVYPSSTETAGESAILKTSGYDFSSLTNPLVKFSWGKSSGSLSANDSVRILYSTDNWATSTFLRSAYRTGSSTQWQVQYLSLPLLSGFTNIRFGFEAYAFGGGEDMAIDDILVMESDCPEATGEAATVNGNDVTFSWNTQPSTDYNVRYRSLPNGPWVHVTPAPVSSPVTRTLTPATSYEWQVRTICGSNAYGWPLIKGTFTTNSNTPNCIQVTGLNTTVSNCSTAVATWSAGATADSFIVRLWKFNTMLSGWQIVSIQNVGNASSVNLTGLLASTQYRLRVIRYCSGVGLNSVLNNFTTISCRLAGETQISGQFSIAPNPTMQNAVLKFNSTDKTQTNISVQDVTGKVVQSLIYSAEEGENTLWLERQNLPSGVYIVTVRNTIQSQSIRWILE